VDCFASPLAKPGGLQTPLRSEKSGTTKDSSTFNNRIDATSSFSLPKDFRLKTLEDRCCVGSRRGVCSNSYLVDQVAEKMECNFARFRYGPTIQTVALYPGIPHEELSNILSTILPVSGKIIGLQDEVHSILLTKFSEYSLEWCCCSFDPSMSITKYFNWMFICHSCRGFCFIDRYQSDP
jgi:hypothetical protein